MRPWSLLVLILAAAAPASAQSAADKSTARRLATEGIELHGQGKHAEALDRLQRAQQLYDAPVHLLYIARTQAKLGQLVEASETYRRLVRVELASNAPQAFRDAIDAGKREVTDVEARIGALRVEVDPPGINGLELTIDGQPVSAAVVGIERPANPGRHSIQAIAPGYQSAEAAVELNEAEKKIVRLQLVADPTAAAAGAAQPAGQARAPSELAAEDAADIGASSKGPRDDWKALHLFVGLRFGAALPAGSLYSDGGAEVPMSDYFKTGASAELHAGGWFAKYFGAKLFVEGYAFAPGPALDRLDEFGAGARVQNQTSGTGLGLSALVGTPLHQFGVFGEVGVTLSQRFSVTREFEAEENSCGDRFQQTLAFTGAALRLGAGARIPVSRFFQLTPYLLASLGQANAAENKSACPELAGSVAWPTTGDLSESTSHRLILVGLGGDVLFGLK